MSRLLTGWAEVFVLFFYRLEYLCSINWSISVACLCVTHIKFIVMFCFEVWKAVKICCLNIGKTKKWLIFYAIKHKIRKVIVESHIQNLIWRSVNISSFTIIKGTTLTNINICTFEINQYNKHWIQHYTTNNSNYKNAIIYYTPLNLWIIVILNRLVLLIAEKIEKRTKLFFSRRNSYHTNIWSFDRIPGKWNKFHYIWPKANKNIVFHITVLFKI